MGAFLLFLNGYNAFSTIEVSQSWAKIKKNQPIKSYQA
jgi:hypothetical protein